MEHLSRRTGSSNWYYREAIPRDVRQILLHTTGVDRREVWKSLGTPDRQVARARLAGARGEQHREWDDLRAGVPSTGQLPSHAEMAEAVVEHIYERFVTEHRKALREKIREGLDLSSEAQRRRAKIAQASLLPDDQDQAAMERLASVLCRKKQWPIKAGDTSTAGMWSELVDLVTKGVLSGRGDMVRALEGQGDPFSRAKAFERLGLQPTSLAKPGEALMELFDRYESECQHEGLKKADTIATERKVLSHLACFVGERRPVTEIGPEHIREFKAALASVPERWTARPELKGLSIADAARTWKDRGGSGRSPTTIRRELSAVSTFFRWLRRNHFYVGANPTADLFPAVDKRKNKYPPYSREQLMAVFGSPIFHRCHVDTPHLAGDYTVRDWRYWLPLCALFTGARAGEIAQLHCSDLRQDGEVWLFDFNDDSGECADVAAKSLKTAASRRQVPIHPALVRLGFVEYVEGLRKKGVARVFPEIQPGPRGDMSYQPSRFWQRYLERLGIKRAGLALHSFRHTFADECRRAAVPKDVLQGLLGHSDGSQTGHYGQLQSGNLRQRQDAIVSLSFYGLAEQLPEPAGCSCQDRLAASPVS